MNIALDYDDTYTRDKIFWDNFITDATERGHLVYLVTARYASKNEIGPVTKDGLLTKLEGRLYFTGRQAKRPFMYRQGIDIHIWIDDNPFNVLHDIPE